MTTLEQMKTAKSAAPLLASAETELKNHALLAMAQKLLDRTPEILAANAVDMEKAAGQISPVMLDRLALNESRIAGMAEGIRQVAALPD
ncbi:MAG: gamma-glutamyl-phosphate reductase, partial [Clostridiales bacterium]|nr:gamma-glutamyl-phosphate reductase [Clostridiales bacterium]